MSDESIDPRYDPRYQRGYDPKRHAPRERDEDYRAERSMDRQEEVAPKPAEPLATEDAPEETATPAPTGVNPFIIAIWILSVGLTVAAGALLVQVSTNRQIWNNALAQLIWTTAPVGLHVGLLGIIALVLWHALRWPGSGDRPTR